MKNNQWNRFKLTNIKPFSGNVFRADYLINLLKKYLKKDGFILNIGVGDGLYDLLISKYFSNHFSYDIDLSSLQNIQKINRTLVNGFAQKLPFSDNSFDGILIAEVLEHISKADRQKTLLEFQRVIKKNGSLIISVPFKENLYYNTTYCPECQHSFHSWGHIDTFDTEKIILELKEANFTISTCVTKTFHGKTNIMAIAAAIIKVIKGDFFQPVQPTIVIVAKK